MNILNTAWDTTRNIVKDTIAWIRNDQRRVRFAEENQIFLAVPTREELLAEGLDQKIWWNSDAIDQFKQSGFQEILAYCEPLDEIFDELTQEYPAFQIAVRIHRLDDNGKITRIAKEIATVFIQIHYRKLLSEWSPPIKNEQALAELDAAAYLKGREQQVAGQLNNNNKQIAKGKEMQLRSIRKALHSPQNFPEIKQEER